MPLLQTKADASAWGYGFLGATASTSNFFLISQQVLGSTSATVTFSSIPNTYKSLQLRVLARDTGGGAAQDAGYLVNFNSDTGNNYTWHKLQAFGSGSVSAIGYVSENLTFSFGNASNGTTSGVFGVSVYDIIDYSSTSKYKTTKYFGGMNDNGTTAASYMGLGSGLWMNTSAINNILITAGVTAFASGSKFSLYGVS